VTPASNYTEWLIRVLAFVGGAGSTVVGSWISSKIRLYHDDRKSHHQELKDKVLLPLRDLLTEQQTLFGHQVPVLTEKWGRSTMPILDARPDQDAFESGAFLHVNDPWPAAFSGLGRALYEDAKRVHYEKLMAEIAALSSSWKTHTANCSMWVEEIAFEILDASKMNPYQPPYQPPYVNHLRLAVWIYRRLFHLPTEALRQSNQGQYWSIEGAPTVPKVLGIATLAKEEHNKLLLDAIEKITIANRDRAYALQVESKVITSQAVYLRSKLEYEMAKKKLRKHCDLVTFF
jgi:hypothetical protein